MMCLSRKAGDRWLVTLVALLAAVSIRGVASAETSQAPALPTEPVAVEALGFAPLPKGKSLEQAHREALCDARRNALIQAHVAVEVGSVVEEMRLKEEVVRSRAAGYVQEMHVWEAGPALDGDPPLYRVRVRALVRPLPQLSAASLLAVGSEDVWRPKLRVEFASNLGQGQEAALKSELISALRRCGVGVVPAGVADPALTLRVRVSSASNEWTRAIWEVGVADPAEQEQGEQALPSVVGDWLIADAVTPEGAWWQRAAVAIAQDALRLWATPRETRITVLGTDEGQARRIAQALGAVAGARVEATDGFSRVVAVLPVAGEPVCVVESLLTAAGVPAAVDRSRVSLTHLTFNATSPTGPGPEAVPASE